MTDFEHRILPVYMGTKRSVPTVGWHQSFYFRESWPRKGIEALGVANDSKGLEELCGLGNRMIPAMFAWLQHCQLVTLKADE